MKYITRFILSVLASQTLFVGAVNAVEDKGGFSLGSTRVIYDGSKKEATFTVNNTARNLPFLVQSWIAPYSDENKAKPPFVITPPLYRQDMGKNILRVIRSGGDLPIDRESAFWLNVKAIPSTAKSNESGGTLSFAYVLRVKLFYRPVGIQGDAGTAYKSLKFSRQGEKIIVNNPTPYHVTLNKVSVGGKEIKNVQAMVPPLGEQAYLLPANTEGGQVIYKALNDMGGSTPQEIKNL